MTGVAGDNWPFFNFIQFSFIEKNGLIQSTMNIRKLQEKMIELNRNIHW